MINHIANISQNSNIKVAIDEATANIKDAKLILCFSAKHKLNEALALLSEKYTSVPILGVSTACNLNNTTHCEDSVEVMAFIDNVDVICGVIENISSAPVKYIKTLEENIKALSPGRDNSLCLEFCTGNEENLVSTLNSVLKKNNISLMGGTALDLSSDSNPMVGLNGKVFKDACVYALIKNHNGRIKVVKENIYHNAGNNIDFIANKIDKTNNEIIELSGTAAKEKYISTLNIPKEKISQYILTNPLCKVVGSEEYIIALKDSSLKNTLCCHKKVNLNDRIRILTLSNYDDIINTSIKRVKDEFKNASFLFSVNCMHIYLLFQHEKYMDTFLRKFSSNSDHIGVVSGGEQFMNQHVNQTIIYAVFE